MCFCVYPSVCISRAQVCAYVYYLLLLFVLGWGATIDVHETKAPRFLSLTHGRVASLSTLYTEQLPSHHALGSRDKQKCLRIGWVSAVPSTSYRLQEKKKFRRSGQNDCAQISVEAGTETYPPECFPELFRDLDWGKTGSLGLTQKIFSRNKKERMKWSWGLFKKRAREIAQQ